MKKAHMNTISVLTRIYRSYKNHKTTRNSTLIELQKYSHISISAFRHSTIS